MAVSVINLHLIERVWKGSHALTIQVLSRIACKVQGASRPTKVLAVEELDHKD
jgi:hypothetical protein